MIDVDGQTETRYYYHYDGLGSVIALSNTDGNIVEAYSYDVFGTPTIYTAAGADGLWRTTDDTTAGVSAVGNPYLFTARRYDDETGLYYYRARIYAPDLGRFMQTDPAGYIDTMNLYAYCANNPVNWIDPWGLDKSGGGGNGGGYTGGFWTDFWTALKEEKGAIGEAMNYGLQEFQNAGSFGLYEKHGLTDVASKRDYYGHGSKWSARVSVGALYSAVGCAAAKFNPWIGKVAVHGAHGGGPHQYPHLQIMLRTGAHSTGHFRIPLWFH